MLQVGKCSHVEYAADFLSFKRKIMFWSSVIFWVSADWPFPEDLALGNEHLTIS